ncbi:hypothetical protein ARAM_007454 [Aspergillus rambellii]|uniref:ubiquitinyl hydrolase 1 n=1 Tax=Aspergillus rambellii TaxID=308745 RepID=A0A0F8X0T9_9EURO|nr:hypothetical protein ARAM_007454 [Aspergillus rambellii]
MNKSQRLSQFHSEGAEPIINVSGNLTHLRERARWRRSIYERTGALTKESMQPKDLEYLSRDSWVTNSRISNVREVVTLLLEQPSSIHTTQNLMGLLEEWSAIGGYANSFVLYNLDEFLNCDITNQWGPLVNLCRNAKGEDIYQLMFQLGVLAFRNGIDMTALRVIVSFFLIKDMKSLIYPEYSFFAHFRADEKPTMHTLLPIVKGSYLPHNPSSISKKKRRLFVDENLRSEYNADCEKDGLELVRILISQWPCAEPSVEGFETTCLDTAQALKAVLPEWQRMYQNMRLCDHVRKVQNILNYHFKGKNDVLESPMLADCRPVDLLGPRVRSYYSHPRLGEELVGKKALNLADIIELTADNENHENQLREEKNLGRDPIIPDIQNFYSPEIIRLEGIVSKLAKSKCSVRSRYAQDLEHSIACLKSIQKPPEVRSKNSFSFHEMIKPDEIMAARNVVNAYYSTITKSFSAGDPRYFWLQRGNLWPCLIPITIFQQLRSTSHYPLGPDMKELLTSYGMAIVKLQKFLRLKEAFLKQDRGRLNQEQNDPGHVNWDPIDLSDWLLLEIDANIQIRQDQVTVALEMISPTLGSNSVLQMNMGQGKMSVIMPMVAAVLADGDMLSRLLVPKALLSQAAQILQSRLGGLLGREIIHIPFSRRTQATVSLIQEYRKLHENILHNSGIILGVPEHILSFKLSGLQRLSDSKIKEAVDMIEMQEWMNKVCRDVLDECDFTLAVKMQLIYPGGAQLAVDGHPSRWEVAMTILGLISQHLKDLACDYPQSMDVMERNSTGFPIAYILRKDVEEALIRKIVGDICSRRLSHTNAEVLTYLLQKRNQEYCVAADRDGRQLSEVGFLKYLRKSGIRILIDAGAFIMEMDNLTVAKAWLIEDPHAQGAVYFSEDNKPWVQYRNGKRVPLLASPFADDMGNCVVYLDEAHTRGTDLKLPSDAKGALTLGLGQTKDHTVQVAFVAPPEVHQSILDVCNKQAGVILELSDVVTWLLDQTCANNRELQALYFSQGIDFCRRMQAAITHKKFLSSSTHRKSYLDILQQPEQQTLEQLYKPLNDNSLASMSESHPESTSGKGYESITSSALEEVEQEREVVYEIKEEREVQRPRRPKALKFAGLHPSILKFAQGDFLALDDVTKVSEILESTQLGSTYKIQGSCLVPRLFLSMEFTRTIKLKKDEKQDSYTRPINWLLFNTRMEIALVIILEEAEELIPIMHNLVSLDVHLMVYAAPVSRSMLNFNDLTYYALPSLPEGWKPPSWLPFELGILAGRLYFEFNEYHELLDRLHSVSETADDKNAECSSVWAIAKSRLGFLQEWLSVRRQGQDITHTPMGYVCQDLQLRSDHPFFASTVITGQDADKGSGLGSIRYNSRKDKEEDYYSSDDGDEMMIMEEYEDEGSDHADDYAVGID